MSPSSRLFFFFIEHHKVMFYILYIFMGGRRAVEGRDGRRLARRREAGGKSLQRSTKVGRYPGSRVWAGAEVGEHLEEGWVRFSMGRAEQGWLEREHSPCQLCAVGWERKSCAVSCIKSQDIRGLSHPCAGCCIDHSQVSTEGWKTLTNCPQLSPQVPLGWPQVGLLLPSSGVRMQSTEEMASG